MVPVIPFRADGIVSGGSRLGLIAFSAKPKGGAYQFVIEPSGRK